MRCMLVTLTLTALCLTPPTSGNLLGDLAEQVAGTILDVTTSVEETLVSAFSSQCTLIKGLLGQNYDQIKSRDADPDLSKLTLNFITKDSYETYNLSTAAEDIAKSQWLNTSQMFVIFVHGYLSEANSSSYRNVSNAFLSRGAYNIVALDASSVLGLFYLSASTYVVYIGEILGKVLAAMYEMGLKPESMYLVGHSLGAHISGFAGKTFHNLTGQRVGRISGLDPAGPCFTSVDDYLRLKSSDADFVDVMHSNAKIFGLNEDIGHVDFYPNGGSTQPDCILPTCSHSFAWHLFAETVLYPNNFTAVACSGWSKFKEEKCNSSDTSLMGFGCSNTTRGTYYLQTDGTIPYGRGDNGTQYRD